MPWLQLHIDTHHEQADRVEDALIAAGAVSVTLQDNADQPILEPALGETPLWNETRITGLFATTVDPEVAVATATSFFGAPLPPYRWEKIEDKNWEREWMQGYQPIQCSDKLWICPNWMPPPDPEATNLLLDPGLAFGTGTHPTTFLCLQWLATQPLRATQVIDYGCGSGILGIAALLLGATRVAGVDIDPQALQATHENVRRNGLTPEDFPVYLPSRLQQDKVVAEGADIILANILAGPLTELAPTLTRLTRCGGKLCLSGILASQTSTVMEAYQGDFWFDPPVQRQEWVRLTANKKN